MPEVVEVCLTALFLDKVLRGQYITDMKIIGGRYAKHKMEGMDLFYDNKDFYILKVDSKGKFLWFELEDKDNNSCFILNRFGMEGEWGFSKKKHSDVMFTIKDKRTNNLKDLYFTDYRHFGTIRITRNKKDLEKELDKLAPDFLKESFTNKEFYQRIADYLNKQSKRKNKLIIKVLMNQTALGSGLGNYLAPTILYKAKISPYKKLGEIYENRKLANYLAESIRYVTKLVYMTADIGYFEDLDSSLTNFVKKLRRDINKNKDHKYNFHPEIKIKQGDKFSFEIYGKDKDPHNNPVKADKIIKGRTTYWSPIVQNR